MITLLLMLIACGNDTEEETPAETTQQTQNVEVTTEVKKPQITPASTAKPQATVENTTTKAVNNDETKTNEATNGETNATND